MVEEVALSDTSRSFRRAGNSEYAFRVPTPPRIIIPPPAHNNAELVTSLRVVRISTVDGTGPDVSFLAAINGGELAIQNAGLEWAYEKRRDAQMITPYLYLGPHSSAAKNRDFLTNQSITMLLAVKHAGTPVNAARRIAEELGITFSTIDVHSPQDLIASFPRATRLINTHLAQIQQRVRAGECPLAHGKVLVFCESGNEKSAAVVVAWIMEMIDLDFLRTMQFVQGQRFCVNFDDNLKTLLQSYGDILDAKRQVALSRLAAPTHLDTHRQLEPDGRAPLPDNNHSGSKRALGAGQEDEMDLDDSADDDLLRFEGRTCAPFEGMD